MSAKKKGPLFPIRKNGPLLYLIHLLLGAAKVTCLLLCNIFYHSNLMPATALLTQRTR